MAPSVALISAKIMGNCSLSAADLKFLRRLARVLPGISNRKRLPKSLTDACLWVSKFALEGTATHGELRKPA
jgi:hypothetical protein